MARPKRRTPISRFALLASVALVVAILYFAAEVLIPLALAVLLSFLQAPLCSRLERRGLPRPVAVLLVVFLGVAAVAGLGYVVAGQVVNLAKNLPIYREEMRTKLAAIRHPGGNVVQRVKETVRDISDDISGTTQPATLPSDIPAAVRAPGEGDPASPRLAPGAPEQDLTGVLAEKEPPPQPIPVRVVPQEPGPVQLMLDHADRVFQPLLMTGIVFVFVIFILIQRADLRDRIIRLAGRGRINITTTALDDAASRISRYLMATAIINGSYGMAIGLGLWLIGWFIGGSVFPNVVLWGLLCALLRFIPYVGPWIAAAFPVFISFVAFPGFAVFATVVALFIVVELLSNNWMEPWLYGSSTGLSTVAVLVSAVFWTWLWGPLGLVMATPLTSCLVVLGRHVPQWSVFPILLGDQPALDPPQRLYQRLLALDAEEARHMLEDRLEATSLVGVFDELLMPALVLAERDRHQGLLEPSRQQFLQRTVGELIDALGDRDRATEQRRVAAAVADAARGAVDDRAGLAYMDNASKCQVLCLPAYDAADELAGRMLVQVLRQAGLCAELVSVDRLTSERIEHVLLSGADVVCISALPPSAIAHARYLCKRLNDGELGTPLVVGLWTLRGQLNRARQRFTGVGRASLATSLSGALDLVREKLQNKLHASAS